MKIIADDKIPFLRGALEPVAEVTYMGGSSITATDVRDADALVIRTRTRCDEALLGGSTVSGIFTATIGFDHIDTSYCSGHDIWWQNAPACNSRSVRQYVASVLAVLRLRCHMELRGKTIAVVGVGNVGRLVAEECSQMGMRVLQIDPPRARAEGSGAFCDLRTALAQADIVTFHTPLIRQGADATFHLLNTQNLGWLKPGAVVINSSRGPVCQTQALIDGLRSGRIGHAVIDVWENEPGIDRQLLDMCLIATPHIAGYSTDSKLRGTQMSVEALCRRYGLATPWKAPQLPPPPAPVFSALGCTDAEEAACRMFLHVYDIEADSRALKSHLSDAAPDFGRAFERLRGDYHLRREIEAFCLHSASPHAAFLRQFGIQSDSLSDPQSSTACKG